ncbi:hypothetical protein [Myxococcus hansupus]|uniref:hypothetical protein n=1 Tax=Pseudomyxococcus hansupus TaxID=1297742 RepID=UPI0003AF2247|nr:hypothetical protein [Myxococcus hansupus]
MRRLLLVSVLALCACSTIRGRADSLAQEGRYVEAATLYEDLVRQSPHEPELLQMRERLRSQALLQGLEAARAARHEGRDDDAEVGLLNVLDHRAAWGTKLSGGMEHLLRDALESTRRHLELRVGVPAREGHALTAEQALRRRQGLLAHPELANLAIDMEARVQASGRASCQRLKDMRSDDSPHWRELVFRYCDHWGESAPRPADVPGVFGAIAWEGSVDGLNVVQQAQLESRLIQVFESSPWYASGAMSRPVFTLGGRFVTEQECRDVERTASWTETVPYTEEETRTEVVNEVQVGWEDSTDVNGVTRSELVTKNVPTTRTYTVSVTHHRQVPRTFEYQALRLSQAHRVAVLSSSVLDSRRAPFLVTMQDHLFESGYEHDVTFHEANVSPERPSFTSAEAWLDTKVAALETTFSERLVAYWLESYCSSPSLTLDEAARCVRAGDATPVQAVRVLADIFGADATHVPALFAWP